MARNAFAVLLFLTLTSSEVLPLDAGRVSASLAGHASVTAASTDNQATVPFKTTTPLLDAKPNHVTASPRGGLVHSTSTTSFSSTVQHGLSKHMKTVIEGIVGGGGGGSAVLITLALVFRRWWLLRRQTTDEAKNASASSRPLTVHQSITYNISHCSFGGDGVTMNNSINPGQLAADKAAGNEEAAAPGVAAEIVDSAAAAVEDIIEDEE